LKRQPVISILSAVCLLFACPEQATYCLRTVCLLSACPAQATCRLPARFVPRSARHFVYINARFLIDKQSDIHFDDSCRYGRGSDVNGLDDATSI
jgi:hypothetical protein